MARPINFHSKNLGILGLVSISKIFTLTTASLKKYYLFTVSATRLLTGRSPVSESQNEHLPTSSTPLPDHPVDGPLESPSPDDPIVVSPTASP